MHEQSARSLAEGGAEPRREWQGCSLFGLKDWGEDTAKKERMHGYSAGSIERKGSILQLRQWPRRAMLQQAQHLRIVADPTQNLDVDEGTRPEQLTARLAFPPD